MNKNNIKINDGTYTSRFSILVNLRLFRENATPEDYICGYIDGINEMRYITAIKFVEFKPNSITPKLIELRAKYLRDKHYRDYPFDLVIYL